MTKLSLLMILVFLVSCGPKSEEAIDGFWSDNDVIIEIHHDTLSVLNYFLFYKFELKDSQIYLTKSLNTDSRPDTLKYPYLLGKLNKNVFVVENFILRKNFALKKLHPKASNQKPVKMQFSSGYWSNGYDFELDTLGNFSITESRYQVYKTWGSKLSKEQTNRIFYLASLVDFRNLKDKYILDCSDAPRYGFVFSFEKNTIKTFISCRNELGSLIPLRLHLESLTSQTIKDTSTFSHIPDKFYESRLLEAQDDTIAQIMYYSHFDSINYKLPKYNFEAIKKIVTNKYDLGKMNVCFHVIINSSGKILNVKFSEDKKIDSKTMDQLKTVGPNNSAIYKGKKITLDYYDCASFKTELTDQTK